LNSTRNPSKAISIIGHIFFLSFLVWAVAFAEERFLAFDAAFYTFDLINAQNFAIQNDRYISYFTQFIALLFVKWGLSLKWVLMAYSITFGFWYYLMFLISNYILKNPKGVLLLIFSLCLALRYKHYAGHTEIVYAIMVASLLFIWVTTEKAKLAWYKPWMHWPILMSLCAWLYIIHPIIVVPLTVILIADVIKNEKWFDWTNWLSIVMVWLSFLLRFSFINAYETKRVGSLNKSFDVFLEPDKFPVVYELIMDYLSSEYLLVLLFFIISLGLLAINKRKLLATCLLLGTISIIAINIVSHSYLTNSIYIMLDGYMGMIGMTIGLSLIYGFEPYWQKPWLMILFSILILICAFQIYKKHDFFEQRLKTFDKTFELNPGEDKLFVDMKFYNWDKMWHPYGMAYESLMWTSLRGKEQGKLIYIDTKARKLNSADSPVMEKILPFDNDDQTLNENYFIWPRHGYSVTTKVGWN